MIYAGYSQKSSTDEQYTPAYAVAPIVKYIPKNKIVWCPFDTEHSEFVLALRDAGIKVVYSHIRTGEDFFTYEPGRWDMIVSNPPFSIKQQVVERCLALDKPFALLLSNLWLNSSAPARLFSDKEMQILLFDKRIQFTKQNAAYFGSSYFCYKVLPRQIIFENLKVDKSLSRMHGDVQAIMDLFTKHKENET
jgi:hypothetical protein